MAETLPPEAASGPQTGPVQGTSPFSEKYDPKRVDYIVQKEGNDVVIRDPLLMNEETKEYEVVGRLTGTKEGTHPGVSAAAEAMRSITSQVPDAERDIRNQFLAFKEEELGVEPTHGPEWEVSPERGRWLVEQVAYMETELPYEVRWNEKNAPILYELSRKLTVYVENTKQKDRYLQDHFDPESEHKVKERKPGEALHEAIKKAYEERIAKGVAKAKKEDDTGAPHTPEDFTGVAPLRELINKYNNILSEDDDIRAAAIAELPQIQEGLLKYFREANGRGLLKGVDEILNSIYLAFQKGRLPSAQVREYTDQKITPSDHNRKPEAYVAAEASFYSKIANDPEVARLFQVWDPYLKWARGRLETTFLHESWTPREGEWRIPGEEEEEESTELYWNPYGGYPNYYEIKARIPAQFRVAKESFLQMLRNKALGYDPNELMTNLINFKQVLTARGEEIVLEQAKKSLDKDLGSEQMTTDFVKELRQEFEGRAFLWHTFYNTQTYNKEGAKQGAMAMAMHEGPERWTRALRSGEEGGVGFHTWNLDNLALVEFALNAQGSRGQFGDRTQVHEYIRSIIKEIQIERGMGVVLKDYDWRDVDLVTDPDMRLKRLKRLEQLDKHLKENNDDLDSFADDDDRDFYEKQKAHSKKNQERIGIHQPSEVLKALYEGFDYGDAHRNNYQVYIIDGELDIDHLPEDFPKKLRDSVRLGEIQVALDKLRQKVRNGTEVLNGKSLIDRLVELEPDKEQKKKLKKLKKLYEKAYANSEASYEVAVQMQGVTHESTIRGGGVYFVQRNKYIREYLAFRQRLHGVQKASDPDINISDWSPQDRAKKFTKGEYIGWILSEIKRGTKFEDLTLEERYLYYDLGAFNSEGNFQFRDQATKDQVNAGTYSWSVPPERESIVDHIPTHLAQKAGMAVVNWVRMKYRDDSPIWDEREFKKRLDEKDENGKHGNFRARYRDAMVQIAIKRATRGISMDGFAVKFYDADYGADFLYFLEQEDKKRAEEKKDKLDKLGQDEYLDVVDRKLIRGLKPMKLKRPHIFGYTQNGQPIIAFDEKAQPFFGFDREGKPVGLGDSDFDAIGQAIIYDKPSGKDRRHVNLDSSIYKDEYVLTERDDGTGVGVYVEDVPLDFQTAADSYLALHTAHTYWAYQSNNTHTLLPEYVFEQARQIRDGKLRPEDADILAGLLLTLDPTLRRVKGFPGEQMTLEGIVFDAAVEESLLGWVDVRNAFKDRFLPNDGNKEHMGTGYYTEDLGGDFRFALQVEALVAKMPDRWARRFRAALKASPMYADTMAGNLGRKGVMGAVSMMDDKIQELTGQRIASQFAITKFINLMDSSTVLWFALIGGTDPKTGQHHEGLFMKPTNNAEKLLQLREKILDALQKPEGEVEVFHAMLESFGRVWDTLKAVRTMYSDQRNAGGALDLRKTDVFLPNGRFNPAIGLEKEKNTGTSRHIAKMFWNAYVDWLLDKGPGGGVQAYKGEAEFYQFLRQPYYWFAGENGKYVKKFDGRDWATWLFDKMAL